MKKMNSRRFRAIVFVAVIYFGGFSAYKLGLFNHSGPEGIAFMEDVQRQFSIANSQEIKISEVAKFDWERVCYHHADSFDSYAASITKNVSEQRLIEKYYTTLSFFSANRMVKLYGYYGEPLIHIRDHEYRFLSRAESEYCLPREAAVLQMRATERSPWGPEVIFKAHWRKK